MSSRKNGADAPAKKAAQLFLVCEGNSDPTRRLSIPDVMRLRGYSQDEAVNRTLQMQVRREVKKLKGNVSNSASAVLPAANVMVALFSTTVTRLASISPEESNDGTSTLFFPSLLKKMRKTSHQRQIDRQNGWKGKDAYALALSQVTTLIAAKREQKKDNARPAATVITQVEGEFKVHGFAVKLAKSTDNRYIHNDMVRTAPLARGYEGIITKAVFKLLVLAVESFIQIKQVNCEVIVRKQLLVVVNKLCDIASGDRIKENMLERVIRLMTVSLDVTIAPAVEERWLLWTTRDNLHTWFLGSDLAATAWIFLSRPVSVASISSLACPMQPPCSRRQTAITALSSA